MRTREWQNHQLATLLAAPFLHGESNQTSLQNQTLTIGDRVHDLTMPFAVGGAMQAAVQLIFLGLFFTKRYERPQNRTASRPSASSGNEPTIPQRTWKLLLCGLCLATQSSAEIGYISFSTAMFQNLDIALSAPQAAYVLSILSSSSTIGRLVTTLLSLKLTPDSILSYHYGLIVSGLSVIFLGRHAHLAIYLGSGLLGYGFSAMQPAMMAFTERHLLLTDRVASFYAFIGAFFSLVTPVILGQLFHAFPLVLFLIEAAFYSVSITCFALLRIWIVLTPRRIQQQDGEPETVQKEKR